MVTSFAVRTDISEQRKAEYTRVLDEMNLKDLVREFLTYLDYTEIKGMDDHEVKPIHISCCRVLMLEPLGMLLQRLRDSIK